MVIWKAIKALVVWFVALVQTIRHGEEDLDDLYPDRHKASGPEAVTNGSIAGHMSGSGMGFQ